MHTNQKENTQTLILKTIDLYVGTLQKHKAMQDLEIAEKLSLIYERISGKAHDEETVRKVNTLYEAFGKLSK